MKKKNIIRKKPKNILTFIKLLTKWIHSPKHDYDIINELINLYNMSDNYVIMRILSYSYNKPHIIWYFNKYMNNLFNFNKFTLIDIIRSIIILMKTNQNTNSKTSKIFIKSNEYKDIERKKVKDFINDYFDIIYCRQLNIKELNFFYRLCLYGHINNNELTELSELINENPINFGIEPQIFENKKTTKTFDQYFNECIERQLPKQLNEFSDSLIIHKQNRPECKQCKLVNAPMITFDTNLDDFGYVDVAFIALNPGKDEVTFRKPLIGQAGKFHRERMMTMPNDTRWLLTNVILCFTNNQKELGKDVNSIISNCNYFLSEILTKFPAIYYVPMGGPAAELFGIKGSIIQNSGKIFNINGCKIIPLPHPSAARQYNDSKIAYISGWNTIYDVINELYKNKTPNTVDTPIISNKNTSIKTSTDIKYNTIESNSIIPKDSTLLDIITIKDKIIYIFVDNNGNKYYKNEKNIMPIYVKDSDWTNCAMIESKHAMNYTCYINDYDRYQLLKTVKDNISTHKQIV